MTDLRKRAAVAQQIIDLGRQGCLTGRDDLLLRTVAEVRGLTLGQARRLGWPEASAVVAYQRLNRLRGWGLLASTPLPPEVTAWGLGPGPIYQLGPAGQLWLEPQITLDWRERPGHWTEPLLAAELLTRLVAEERTVRWHGAQAAQEGFKLELKITGAAQWQTGRVIFHLTGLARRNVDWAGLAQNFHRSAQGRKSPLPPLAVLLPDAAQATQVSELIDRRLRRGEIRVLVTDWPALAATPRLTEAPIWRLLRPKELALTGQTLASVASG